MAAWIVAYGLPVPTSSVAAVAGPVARRLKPSTSTKANKMSNVFRFNGLLLSSLSWLIGHSQASVVVALNP